MAPTNGTYILPLVLSTCCMLLPLFVCVTEAHQSERGRGEARSHQAVGLCPQRLLPFVFFSLSQRKEKGAPKKERGTTEIDRFVCRYVVLIKHAILKRGWKLQLGVFLFSFFLATQTNQPSSTPNNPEQSSWLSLSNPLSLSVACVLLIQRIGVCCLI